MRQAHACHSSSVLNTMDRNIMSRTIETGVSHAADRCDGTMMRSIRCLCNATLISGALSQTSQGSRQGSQKGNHDNVHLDCMITVCFTQGSENRHVTLQGTNAHAVLCRTGISHGQPAEPTSVWQRDRFWFTVRAHALLLRAVALPQQGSCTMQTPLDSPSLAFLFDHCVQDRALFPGAAMFETASAAMRAMQAQPLHAASQTAAALVAVSIAQPLVMVAGQATTLCCTVSGHEGRVAISSVGRGAQIAHMTAVAGASI